MDLSQGSIPKLLLKFSVPAIAGMIINAIYSFIDKVFISQMAGPLAFSGIVAAMPMLFITIGFSLFIGVGAATQISIRMGENRNRIAAKTLGNAFVLFLLISGIITVLGLLFLEPLLILYGARGEVLHYAMIYLRILIGGSVLQTIGFGMTHLIRAMGKPNEAMIVLIVSAVINIILSFVFVVWLNLGVAGAAISTLIAHSITLVLAFYILLSRKNTTLRLRFRNFKLDWKIVGGILAVGMSPFAKQIMGSVVLALTNNVLRVHGGDLAFAAMGIITQFGMLFLMPLFGLNQGAQPILGYNYGAKRYERIRETLKYTVGFAAVISFIGWCFIFFFPQVPIRIFTDDPELIAIAITAMPIFGGAFLLAGMQMIMAMFFQSIGKAKIALVLNLLRQVILFIPLLLILPRIFGLDGVWFAGLWADIAAFVITSMMFVYTVRTKLRSIA